MKSTKRLCTDHQAQQFNQTYEFDNQQQKGNSEVQFTKY